MKNEIEFDKYKKRGAYHWAHLEDPIWMFYNILQKSCYQQIAKLINQTYSDDKILDIGCGDGVLFSLLLKANRKLVGVDLDITGVSLGNIEFKQRKLTPNPLFIQANTYQLPLQKSQFDIVYSIDTIEHLTQPEKLISEAKRVLKPGGKLIVSTDVASDHGFKDELHVHEFSPQELIDLFKSHDFKNIKLLISHPRWLYQLYQWKFKIGRFHFPIFRYGANLLEKYLKINLFSMIPAGDSGTNMIVFGKKPA